MGHSQTAAILFIPLFIKNYGVSKITCNRRKIRMSNHKGNKSPSTNRKEENERDDEWTSNRQSNGASGKGDHQDSGVPGMNPDGLIQTNWDECCENFDDMGLREELLRGVYAYGFEKPSAIQQRAIVPCIKGYDVIAQAQSGTGKTATFSISALQSIDTKLNECQALVLAPTRELAQQIQ